MRLISEDATKKIIKVKEEIKFSSSSGFYLLLIQARVKSKKQLAPNATDDEDLVIKVDGKIFPKLGDKRRLIDSPAAFSGGSQHNLLKTVYILTFLRGKNHILSLETDKPSQTATLEKFAVYKFTPNDELNLGIEDQAEDGDRRPWITIALDGFEIQAINSSVTVVKRKWDSDDIKIIIDGKNKRTFLKTIKYFLWKYIGSLLSGSFSKTITEEFQLNLPKRLHYIEYWADRMPTLHKLKIEFSHRPISPEGVSTVDNPKWTGDFYDDTEEILLARLLLGEAENQSREAKIWIAGSILNRVRAQAWPNTIHEVILQEGQYDPFKPSDQNYAKITDPLNNANAVKIKAWQESYEIAEGILSGKIENPTEATHFHGVGVTRDWFIQNVVPDGKFLRQIDDTYFYWGPN